MQLSFSVLYKYRYGLLAVGAVVLVAVGAWAGWFFYDQAQNKKAEDQIYPLRLRLLQAEKKAGGDVLTSSFYSQKKAENFDLISHELKDYKDFLISQKKFRPVHWISAIELAYFFIQYQRQEEALELLSAVNIRSKSKNWIYQTLLLQLGTLFMEKKNFTRALNLFSLILSHDDSKPFHIEALLKSAVCYEAMGELEKAGTIYAEIQKNEEAGLYKERAVHYDRLFKIKQKLGSKAFHE